MGLQQITDKYENQKDEITQSNNLNNKEKIDLLKKLNINLSTEINKHFKQINKRRMR